jgi:hypothetical protein
VKTKALAASTVALFVLFGGGVALDAACSPNASTDAGDAGPVCVPDSGDPSGCPCDPTKTTSVDCYSGPPGSSSKGICKPGKRSCTSNGTYSVCVGEVLPLPETCNYADDNCDGIIDNMPEIEDAAVIAYCNSPACDPNFTDAAITCFGPDPGICGAGTKACKGGPGGGTPTGCNEFIHGGAPEVCNGIDDDCNGAVDDGLDQEGACDMPAQSSWPDGGNPFEAGADGSLITRVYGECIHGQLACHDGGDKCAPSQPTTEVQNYGAGCDGLDNDCDGVIDNHACSDTFDKQNGYIYCCDEGYGFYCENSTSYGTCKLAN